MIKSALQIIIAACALFACDFNSNSQQSDNIQVEFNLIEPGNGIYVVIEKNVDKAKIKDKNFEAVYLAEGKKIKIERYDSVGNLTDKFSVAAVTKFEYDSSGNVKFVEYYDKEGIPAEDDIFGYWSIEYIYDELNRVRMEIYRDSKSKFLKVPLDSKGNIAKINFIAPILTYEYLDDQLKIKALDQNFNMLKEVIGDKPCIPFIDCGETD